MLRKNKWNKNFLLNSARHFATTLGILTISTSMISCANPVSLGQSSHVEQTPKTSRQDNLYLNAHEPGEVCVINVDEAEAKLVDTFAQAHGYAKKKRRTLTSLGFVMSIFKAPAEQDVQEAIRTLREAFPSYIIDANHHFYLQEQQRPINLHHYGHQIIGLAGQAGSCPTQNITIGMIDTAVNTENLLTAHRTIETKSFIPPHAPKPQVHHGTAVATLLVGQAQSMSDALLPNASLFVAEAFRQKDAENIEATTWSIVRSLDWLVEQHVQVINLSLGGPPNALLSYAIKKTLIQGIPIIAAGGNAGPDGYPVYPAAQEGVLAVTALDAKLQPYRHANQGTYITFSAPGVDIWIPDGSESGVFKSGTSFATPFVTAVTALVKQAHPQWTPEQIEHQLATTAVDLGVTGKDHIFGWGLIQTPPTCLQNSHP